MNIPANQVIHYNGWYLCADYGYRYLTTDQINSNGLLLAKKLYRLKWTEQAIAGLLGNVELESGMNPGTCENTADHPRPFNELLDNTEMVSYVDTYTGGIGFTQWTPGAKKYVRDFCNTFDPELVWYDGDSQVKRLQYEAETNVQMPNMDYYIKSTQDPADMAEWFLYAYEKPTPEQAEASVGARRRAASRWYSYIHGKLHKPIDYFIWSKQNRERKEMRPPCRRM